MTLGMPAVRNSDAVSRRPTSRNVSLTRSIASSQELENARASAIVGAPNQNCQHTGQLPLHQRANQPLGVLAVPLGGAQQPPDLAALGVEQQRRRQADD